MPWELPYDDCWAIAIFHTVHNTAETQIMKKLLMSSPIIKTSNE
ncbi:MAG: hypothetical protein AAGD25_13470 [Cyanobacteria bacterium P01_F01_bin.150]